MDLFWSVGIIHDFVLCISYRDFAVAVYGNPSHCDMGCYRISGGKRCGKKNEAGEDRETDSGFFGLYGISSVLIPGVGILAGNIILEGYIDIKGFFQNLFNKVTLIIAAVHFLLFWAGEEIEWLEIKTYREAKEENV